ncbi:MAG: hypothetical protein L0Y71_23905 [Gemmataceae bacterium]|nr:hypothetical protein [Gemmataceae bacterium]
MFRLNHRDTVDQQSNAGLAQAQIGQELSLVNGMQFLHGLELDDQTAREEQVHLELAIQLHTLVLEGYLHF